MFNEFLLAFVPIFVAVDAPGLLPVFITLTHGMPEAERRRLIQHSTLTALVVAVVFLWVGRFVFSFLGITMSDFLVAGGAILFIISIRDLLSFERVPKRSASGIGVVPLAVPIMVGPAVLTTSLILLNSFGFYPTFLSIVFNIGLCGVVLYYSTRLSKLLGEAGSNTLSKIFSLLLGAIGVMLMRRGVLEIFSSFTGTN